MKKLRFTHCATIRLVAFALTLALASVSHAVIDPETAVGI